MTETTTGYTPTGNDVAIVARALRTIGTRDRTIDAAAAAVVDAIGPIIERERKDAYSDGRTEGYSQGFADGLAERGA